VTDTAIAATDLVERLARHRMLGSAPRPELEWLVAHGRLRRYVLGEPVTPRTEEVTGLLVIFTGHFAIHVDRGAGPRMVMEWRPGDVTGLLPFSRMRTPPGDSVTLEAGEGLELDREHFPDLVRECPNVTAILVHLMLDRARIFNTSDLHDEKMMSLGKLAAGLAHELNNPASAAARSAKLLAGSLADAEAASRALGALTLTDGQRAVIDRVREMCRSAVVGGEHTPLERSDREEAMGAWLERHGASTSPAPALAGTAVTMEALEALAGALPREALDTAVRWIVANYQALMLAVDIDRAATRVHDLVGAVKRFTYMDQQRSLEEVDLSQGLADTIAVLGSKARASSATVALEIEPGLPRISGSGAELNQVWLNLLDNALDAVAPKAGATGAGRVTVSAKRELDAVVVRVIDNGPGIPPEVRGRVFDPFFTTKPMGQGTGLGLDIAQRIARAHRALIEVDSRPGRPEFRLSLPAVAGGPRPAGGS
jgi:signal transduction histidine kinase